MTGRRSSRSHKVVDYSKFTSTGADGQGAGDGDDDDDFTEFTPPVAKKQKREKPKKEKKSQITIDDDDFSSPPRKKKNKLSVAEKMFERELELVMDLSKKEVTSQSSLSSNPLLEEQNTSILNLTDCEDLKTTTSDNRCSETVVCEVYEQRDTSGSSTNVTSPAIQEAENAVAAGTVGNREAKSKSNKKHTDSDSDENYTESEESEDDSSPESDDDSDFDACAKDKKTKTKTPKHTKTPSCKPQAKPTVSGTTKNSSLSKVGLVTKAVARDTGSVKTTLPARNIPKLSLTPKHNSAAVSVCRKAWTPPAPAGDASSDSIRSPSTGLRLGLSKRARIKPLHGSVKVTH